MIYYVLYKSRWRKCSRYDYYNVILATKQGHLVLPFSEYEVKTNY